MEPSKSIKPSNQNQILNDPKDRYSEIYKIFNLINGKLYVGQTVSHILNHNKYRPYGHEARFRCHISEAFSKKKNQSHYLNNAIRKYGVDNFKVELIEYCDIDDSDEREIYYIKTFNTLFPNGYNLKNGGNKFTHSEESKKRVSKGVLNYFKDKKILRFKNIKSIDGDYEKYIRPLNRQNKQYGWYVYIDGCKTDFGGVHIPLEESKQNAISFILKLIESFGDTFKLRETSLEPSLPLTLGNICEELG